MTMKKYNILWLDDDFKESTGDAVEIKEELEKQHKDLVFYTAWNSYDFEGMLQGAQDHYDAVILDVRGYLKPDSTSTTRSHAFTAAINALNNHKFTGVRVYLSGQTYIEDDEKNDIENALELNGIKEDEIISKVVVSSDPIKFGDELKAKIEEANTPEHQMRTKYPEACEIAADCSCETELFDILLHRKNVINCTGGIRDIIESCIIPELQGLNIMPDRRIAVNSLKIFEDGKKEGIELTPDGEKLMHKTLAHAFSFVIDVCQDANHKKNDLHLHVKDYMNLYGGERILDASTNILVEVLTWLHRIKSQRNGVPFNKDEIYTVSFTIQGAQVQQDSGNPAVFYIETNSEKYMLPIDKKDNNLHKDLYGNVINPGDLINLTILPTKTSKVSGYDKYVDIYTIVLAN